MGELLKKQTYQTVLIQQTRIPRYREEFFLKLIDLGYSDGVEYKIVVSKNRSKKFQFESKMTKNVMEYNNWVIRFGARELHLPNLARIKLKARVVICEYGLKNAIVYWYVFIKKPSSLGFWGHGDTTTKEINGIERSLKKILLKRADFFLAYTESCLDKLMENRFLRSKIQVVNNSVDTTAIIDAIKDFEKNHLASIYQEFQVEYTDIIFVFIGSLGAEKRIDFLLEAFLGIHKLEARAKLLIFSPDNFLHNLNQEIQPYIKFLGTANTDTKVKISYIATALLNPGRVGLIAVDSFAMKIPIITTNWTFHAPEFSYLNSKNSIITKDSIQDFILGSMKIIEDAKLHTVLKSGCEESANLYSIEKMAQNFHAGVLKILKT